MRFTRRKLLGTVGVGGLTLGGAFSSGAFSQTEVDREFDLQIAADSKALLALESAATSDNNDIESYEAVESGAVTSDERDLLQFDFSGDSAINNQADTAFANAFEITNNSSEAVYVWMPTHPAGDPLKTGLLSSANRSTEFRVSDPSSASDYVGGISRDDNNVDEDGDALDLSFPPDVPKYPSDTNITIDETEINEAKYGGANQQSRAFGMTPGGAVELSSGGSVLVGIRFLIRGSLESQDGPTPAIVRFKAVRSTQLTNEKPDDKDWVTTFRDVDIGQTRNPQ